MRNLVAARMALAAVTGAAAVGVAGPVEDFADGQAAYRRGDVRGAITILRRAADSGHAKAQVFLGNLLDASDQDEEAARYFGLAAAQGDPDGAYLLAAMHSAGTGVAVDQAKARRLLEEAASRGHASSTVALALACLRGGLDLTEAERQSANCGGWLAKAGDSGHLPSLERLAQAYRKGELGLARDDKLAEATEARIRSLLKVPEKAGQASRRRSSAKPAGGG